nr:unnamed protein product [Naegleria fowleri]
MSQSVCALENPLESSLLDKYLGCILGMAVGDAYGTTFEFIPRHGISDHDLTDELVGGGKFRLMKGMFTDDTSMALLQAECLLSRRKEETNTNDDHSHEITTSSKETSSTVPSLFEQELENFPIEFQLNTMKDEEQNGSKISKWIEFLIHGEPRHTLLDGRQIQNKFLEWYHEGHLSASGDCFDIGKTILVHLLKNEKTQAAFCPVESWNDQASGNGALMRLAPVPLYYYRLCEKALLREDDKNSKQVLREKFLHRVITESGISAFTTHPSQLAFDCNRYMAALMIGCMQGVTKEELFKNSYQHEEEACDSYLFVPHGLPRNYWQQFPLRKEVREMIQNFKSKSADEISNSGYAVTAFEAALWSFASTDTYFEGLKKIVRLGDDADTVACIYGQLAGCFYGVKGIPEPLISQLVLKDLLKIIATELYYSGGADIAVKNDHKEEMNSHVIYKNVMSLYYNLENSYKGIHRRSNPCPKQFKTIEEFDLAVSQMIQEFEKHQQEILQNLEKTDERLKCQPLKDSILSISNSILQDFKTRCDCFTKPPLLDRLNRFSGPPSRPFIK